MNRNLLSDEAVFQVLESDRSWASALQHVVANLWAAQAAATAAASSRSAEEIAHEMAEHFVATLSPTMSDENRRSISSKICVLGSDAAGLLSGEGLRKRAPKSFAKKKR